MFSGDLGYMQKSIYTWFQFNECAEVCHTCDCSFYYVSYSIFFICIQPRVLIFELQAQCDLISVDIFDQNFDRLADFEDLLRVFYSSPRHLGDMQQTIRSAQIDAGGLTVAFAPLADGSDFVAAYCEIPYTEVALSEDGMTLTVTMHDTFLSSGTLSKDVDLDFLKEYGSLYPESFPAGELAGSCTLIENADLRQDGNNAVLTVTLADGPIHGRNFGDGYYRFTAETGYTGIADTGPYLRVTLNATNELFAGD